MTEVEGKWAQVNKKIKKTLCGKASVSVVESGAMEVSPTDHTQNI